MTDPALMAQIMRYADWGWCVIPLHTPIKAGCSCHRSGCDKIGKHPRITDWPEQATTDIAVIQRWWKQWPTANVGIATNTHLYVLDVDGEQGRDTLARLEAQHGALPETPRGLTGGGGEHYLFTLPGGVTLGNTVRFAPGLDTRGPGGQIVAPPSRHVSGKAYTWDAGAHPDDVAVAEMPQWVCQLIARADTKARGPLGSAGDIIPHGSRDATLFKHGSRLRNFGYNEAEILATLLAMNQTRCQPPLEEGQVREKVKQALGYHAGPFEQAQPTGDPDALPIPQTLTELLAKDIPEPIQLIKNLMHEGMLLFGGKSKRGKSWLMLDLALSVATGRAAFRNAEFPCRTPAPVLYLALEDGEGRVKRRAKAIQANLARVDTMHILYDFPPLVGGGIDRLTKYIEKYGYQLVIIDVLAKLEPAESRKDGGEKGYHDVYGMFAPLQALRQHHHFCLAMLTHLRKQDAEDVFDTLHGSVAYQGAQDVLWVLERKPKDDYAFLHLRDKDAEDRVLTLRFMDGHWEYIGEGESYELSRDQRTVVKVLTEETAEMGIKEILRAADMPEAKYGYLRKLLVTMVKEDMIHRTKRGNYTATIRGAREFAVEDEDDEGF